MGAKTLLFLMLITCIFSRAQNPGYMGKRLVAGYGFYFNPAITAALIDYGTKIINTQHEFFMEGALKRSVSMGFSVKLYKSTYNNTSSTDLSDQFYAGSTNSSTTLQPGGITDIVGRNYALYFKFHKRGYVAPWGRYFLLGLTLNTRECRYDPYTMVLYYNDPRGSGAQIKFNNFGPTVQDYKYVDLMIGNGTSRIIANRFVFDYGYNINVVAFTMAILDAFDEYEAAPEKYIQTNSGMRVRGINRFNFFVKLGYLF